MSNEQIYQVGDLNYFTPADPKYNTLGECVKHCQDEDPGCRNSYGIWDMTENIGELVAIYHEGQYFKAF